MACIGELFGEIYNLICIVTHLCGVTESCCCAVGQSGDEASQTSRPSQSHSTSLPEREPEEPVLASRSADRRRRRSFTELSQYVPQSPGVLGRHVTQSVESASVMHIPSQRHTSSAFTDLPHSCKLLRGSVRGLSSIEFV